MRVTVVFLVMMFLGCGQPKPVHPATKIQGTAVSDSIVGSVSIETPASLGELNWENVMQLMNSLEEIPFEQRSVTLNAIKNEAFLMTKKTWPEVWNNNPVRSRYNVFFTHASIAAEQRYDNDAPLEQANAIAKMKHSWNIFARQLKYEDASAVLETTLR